MNNFEIFFYFLCFGTILGASFAMMWGNIQSINRLMDEPPPRPRHPEAPAPGDEVMYVDVSGMSNTEFKHKKKWLEDMYNK